MKDAYRPKKRNSGNRQRKSVILISAEGKNKTEKLYFDAFNGGNVNIRFTKGNETDPVHLANALVRDYKASELDPNLGDIAFCIVDEDLSPLQEQLIQRSESIIRKINGTMIVSNPCFEIWYICHYGYSTKQYASNQDVVNTLKKYVPDYEKGFPHMQEILAGSITDAITNAKRLEMYHEATTGNAKRYNCQPRTDVYIVIEVILKKNITKS